MIVFSLYSFETSAAPATRFGETLASANGRVYAIQKDGSLWYWGKGTFNDSAGDQSPERAKITKLMDNAVGVYGNWWSGFAIKSDHSMWKFDDDGQAVKVMDDVQEVANSYTQWIALKTDGTVWRGNIYGESKPKKMISEVTQISAGIESFYTVKEDGTLWGWGQNYSGELGVKTKSPDVFKPILIMEDVAYVRGAGQEAYAVKKDGSLWGWGNSDGLIFTGKDETWAFDPYKDGSQSVVTSQFTPSKLMDDVRTIDGRNHLAVINKDGSLWLWGDNSKGQLGDGTQTSRLTPKKALDDVVDVTAEGAYTIALKSDGTLWGFGTNSSGELGLGSFDYESHPTPISLMDNVAIPGTEASFPSSWANSDIQYAKQEGLLPVSLQSRYQSHIKREEFIALIVRLIEKKTGQTLEQVVEDRGLIPAEPFLDTDDPDILRIAATGIINGVGGGKFDPSGLITREQAALILTNTARFLDVDSRIDSYSGPLFADDKQLSQWAKEAVYYCLQNNIMRGIGDNSFGPKTYYSREMSMSTIVRLYKLTNGE